MIVSVHQPQYLPWLGYFHKIAKSDSFVFLDKVQYKPREFENRNKIRTKEGWMWLSVPIVSKGRAQQPLKKCIIDNSFPWRRQHMNSLKAWYGKAPYFKDHQDFFAQLYAKEWLNFCDFNVTIIKYIMRELKITTPLYWESQVGTTKTRTERIIEICLKLHADCYLSGSGGRAYLDEDKFSHSNIRLIYQEFTHPVYAQQFAKETKDFLPFMSAVDLLFNAGPSSREILGL